jgi:DNA-binding response OmpR family regulator
VNKQPLKIFLADDDEDDRELFHEALNSASYSCELITVNNGEKAINFFKENNYIPDLIFLDINMPKRNGIECLKFIKELHPAAAFHIIMLSTSSSANVIDTSYRNGASIYIQKPSHFHELVQYIKYCMTELKAPAKKEDFLLNTRFNRQTI